MPEANPLSLPELLVPEQQSTPAGAPVSPLPRMAMDALEAARTALQSYEREIAVRESALRERALQAEARIVQLERSVEQERAQREQERSNAALERGALEGAIVELRSGNTDLDRRCGDLDRQCGDLKRENDALRADNDALRTQETQVRESEVQARHSETQARESETQTRLESERFKGERDAARSESISLRAQLATQRSEGESLRQEAREHKGRAEAQTKRNEQMRHDLMEMHRDLMATDASTLILRTAMSLTGAEQGLFTDETGEHIISEVGMEDISLSVKEQLFPFLKQALREEAPVVRNDGENLPDSTQCVNLAALPVAVQNEAGGAILVANKRSGPFDDDDTQVLLSVGKHAGIAIQNQRLHFALEDAYRMTIAVLADAIEAKDPYTRGHCESVSRLAVAVAQELGCSGEELDIMRYAALLHDVGKIGVSDGVLLKPSKLLPEEFSLIQRHSAIGADLIKRIPALNKVVPLILHHHEHVDGSGYPDGLDGEGIPLGARIIGAVDAFDAMTTPRPYRNPVSHEEALSELRRCSGTQFDTRVVDSLSHVLSENDMAPERMMETH